MTVEPGGSGAPMSERMQSLLSRAVEDQLSEQRQIAGVLTDIRTQLQRVTADIAALREQPPGDGGSDAALSTVSADVREAVRLLGERIDGVARLVQQRGSDLAELRGQLEQMQTSLRGHGDALSGVSGGLAALPAFGERIGGLQGNLEGLHERLAGLDALSGGVAALQQRVDAVDQGLRDLRSAFAAVGARMAELPGRADLDGIAARSAAPLADVGQRLTGVEQTIAGLAAQIQASTDDDADRADDEPDQAAALVAELRAELARFAAATTDETRELARQLSAVDARLTEVLDAVSPAADEEAADHVTDEDDVEDPVLTELAELREALLGEDGLAARVDAVATDALDERVAAAVEQAVAASERRLSAHIDEAVLALAEALLRRRGPRAPSSAVAPVAEAADDEAEALPDDADDADEMSDAEAADEGDATVAMDSPWQIPGADPPPLASKPVDQDVIRRRRPWWRPGD